MSVVGLIRRGGPAREQHGQRQHKRLELPIEIPQQAADSQLSLRSADPAGSSMKPAESDSLKVSPKTYQIEALRDAVRAALGRESPPLDQNAR